MTEATRWDCDQAFRRIDDYLDRELGAADLAGIEEHLAECERCATEFRFEAGVLDEIKGKVRRISVPESLQSRLRRLLDALEQPD